MSPSPAAPSEQGSSADAEARAPQRPRREPAIWLEADLSADPGPLVAAGYPEDLARLLVRRGIETPEAACRFLEPQPDHLHDPFALRDMEAAVERLLRAQRDGEKVAIVGDYDVDGVTATALLTAVLRAHGIEVLPILPHRMRDGYGFQVDHAHAAHEEGASIVVTVDCGTTSKDAVEAALELGLDVVVTDHHIPGADFPSDALQINPLQPECDYPCSVLSGAGLALKLVQGLCQRSGRSIELAPLLRIAALGTVADVVPLIGENRVITSLGLDALSRVRAPGLSALVRVAGLKGRVTSEDIGFRLGPRLNAAGRLDSAERALELLLCRDPERAAALAEGLDQLNRDRREEEERVVEEARERFTSLSPLPGILVAWSDQWHRGVVGIAAGRLARELHRPTLLLAQEESTATGSGRSIPGIGLHDFLARHRESYLRFGGHDVAVGMTVANERLEELRSIWEAEARWPEELLERRIHYELHLEPAEVTIDLLRRLRALEPHGPGNRRPVLRVGPLELCHPVRHFGENHVKGLARHPDGPRDAGKVRLLGWRFADRVEEMSGRFEVVGHLEWDDYLESPILSLSDLRGI